MSRPGRDDLSAINRQGRRGVADGAPRSALQLDQRARVRRREVRLPVSNSPSSTCEREVRRENADDAVGREVFSYANLHVVEHGLDVVSQQRHTVDQHAQPRGPCVDACSGGVPHLEHQAGEVASPVAGSCTMTEDAEANGGVALLVHVLTGWFPVPGGRR